MLGDKRRFALPVAIYASISAVLSWPNVTSVVLEELIDCFPERNYPSISWQASTLNSRLVIATYFACLLSKLEDNTCEVHINCELIWSECVSLNKRLCLNARGGLMDRNPDCMLSVAYVFHFHFHKSSKHCACLKVAIKSTIKAGILPE